jgi:membrane-associated phospholipid phosphatase
MLPLFLDKLGEYGPYVMIIMSAYILWTTQKQKALNYVFVGLCLNFMVNTMLKYLFKYPRPIDAVDMVAFNAKKNQFTFLESIKSDPFGFPSGHSQQSSYVTMVMFYILGAKPITLLYACYTVLIMSQRVLTSPPKHYVYQVIAGAVTGAIVATGVYFAYKRNIIGAIAHKLDDWSRIRM